MRDRLSDVASKSKGVGGAADEGGVTLLEPRAEGLVAAAEEETPPPASGCCSSVAPPTYGSGTAEARRVRSRRKCDSTFARRMPKAACAGSRCGGHLPAARGKRPLNRLDRPAGRQGDRVQPPHPLRLHISRNRRSTSSRSMVVMGAADDRQTVLWRPAGGGSCAVCTGVRQCPHRCPQLRDEEVSTVCSLHRHDNCWACRRCSSAAAPDIMTRRHVPSFSEDACNAEPLLRLLLLLLLVQRPSTGVEKH